MPFCGGVALVILSIFIYGAKADQVQGWVDAIKISLGMRPSTEYNLVAQMEPLNADEPAPPPTDPQSKV